MHAPEPHNLSYDYAVIRAVPRVERAEFVNVGVVVFCLARKVLLCRTHLDEGKLLSLSPDLDLPLVREHLAAIPRICSGAPDAGPVAQLSVRERFHWLVAPRSTIIQTSPVHSGLCVSPGAALDCLFDRLVA